MKSFLVLALLICTFIYCRAQNIGIGTTNPDPSAILHLEGTDRGLLLPRMTTAQMSLINTPAEGLIVYASDVGMLYIHSEGQWKSFADQVDGAWMKSGNAGTNPESHFIGTLDNQPIIFKVNNLNSGKIDDEGNVFFGLEAGMNHQSAIANVGIGRRALFSNATSNGNVAVGDSALCYNGLNASDPSHSNNNTAVGTKALKLNNTGHVNTAFGSHALNRNAIGSYNTAIGSFSLYLNTAGYFNTATGYAALLANTTGNNNAAFGSQALYYNTTGQANVAIGTGTLYSNVTGANNTATGAAALNGNVTGGYNSAHGFESLNSNTVGSFNTALGSQSLRSNTQGNNNTAVGNLALYGNTWGNFNTALGNYALRYNTTGINNVAQGHEALKNNTTGSSNTAVGTMSLSNNTLGILRTAVGYSANSAGTAYNNSAGIGYNADPTATNQIRIGNTSVTSIGGFADWTNVSDGRFKQNITEDVKGLEFISMLRPVTYTLDQQAVVNFFLEHYDERDTLPWDEKYEASQEVRSGFIAQEVEAAAQAIGYDFYGVDKPKNPDDFYGLRYATFVVPLVKAVQELNGLALEQQLRLAEQQLVIEKLSKEVDRIVDASK